MCIGGGGMMSVMADVEARCQFYYPSSGAIDFISKGRVSYWIWDSPIRLGWPTR